MYGKAEFLNPGGSVKDRIALQIVREAWESGALKQGALITEGTAGSTGVSLAMVREHKGPYHVTCIHERGRAVSVVPTLVLPCIVRLSMS